MKYRSRSDIVGLLLDAANGGGATKTKLMYKAYLSFNQLREYLAFLIENGLIDYEGHPSIAATKQNRGNSSN
jgi:predicted transcriptional regulator